MSAQQQEHSKLYKRYNSDRRIPELVRKEKGDVEVYRLSPLGADLSDSPTPTTSDILRRATCDPDAVVLGLVKSKSSQLTQAQSFVFTDYGITIEQVLKHNESTLIAPQSEITITRPGGTVLLDSKKVRAIDESFRPLKPGQRYLLFLQFLPTTGTYRSIETGESFEVRGNEVKSLKGDSLERVAIEHSANSLMNEVVLAAASPCKGNRGGVK